MVLVSNNIQQLVPSNKFPEANPCPVIGNLPSAFTFLSLVIFVHPKYVVLKSEFSTNLLEYISCVLTFSYTSKYLAFTVSESNTKVNI